MGKGILFRKKFLFLSIILVLPALCYAVVSFGDTTTNSLPSFFKSVPTGLSETIRPNVLILVDTSGSMTWPIDKTSTNANYCTRGDGSKPYNGRFYYGKDVDPNNNTPSNELSYHPNLKVISEGELADLSSGNKTWMASKVGNAYYYPNDSRMYQLKVVLWKIFHDETLISDLNMGLATFDQKDQSSYSSWYQIGYYNWSGEEQLSPQQLSVADGNEKARLRQDFAPMSDPANVSNLQKWVDGTESSTNPELRAVGSTPLGNSIYNASSVTTDSAYTFFNARTSGTGPGSGKVVKYACQQNWLIVITDGEDQSLTKDQLASRVAKLHTINVGATDSVWPRDAFENRCLPVNILFIGMVEPDSTPSLKEKLEAMAANGYEEIDENGNIVYGKPYYVTDIQGLLDSLETIFTKIQERTGTGGAPLVSPARVEGASSSLYVAKFLPRQQLQWKGFLERYTLNSDGTIPASHDWEAGTKLNSMSYTARNIYTVDWDNPPSVAISGSNLVRMSEGNASLLENVLDPGYTALKSLDTLKKFIRWLLGSDEFNEGRWKLGDTFHSGLTEVGPPQGTNPYTAYREFLKNNSLRPQVLYVQTNDGILHAFNVSGDASTAGKERWAFIPPNVASYERLLGLKGSFTQTEVNTYMNSTKSVPRYILDGPLVAEDVYVKLAGESTESWHTVLLGSLGYGGTGLYAMDVTVPDKPRFLWAFENAILKPNVDSGAISDEEDAAAYGTAKERQIHYWVGNDDGTVSREVYSYPDVPGDLNYRYMLFSVSTPSIGSMRFDSNYKWVAVVGSGSRRGLVSLQNTGIPAVERGAVYVIDIASGKIQDKTFFTGNQTNVVTPITVRKTNSVQNIQIYYAGTENGDIYRWDETSQDKGHWIETPIFSDGTLTTGPSYRIDIATVKGSPWIFFATGDSEHLVGDPRTADTQKNYIVSCKADTGSPLNLGNLQNLDQAGETSTNPKGWYFKLATNEFPSTPPKIYNGYLFVGTFVYNSDPCETGTSRLYVMKADTGEGAWGTGKAKSVSIQGLKISGITLLSGKAYIGITDYTSSGATLPTELAGAQKGNNVMVFDVPAPASGNTSLVPSGQMVPFYWREWRQ